MVGRAAHEGRDFKVSHQTIYNFIYKHKPEWITYLPYRRKRKYKWKKRDKSPGNIRKINIVQRGESANERKETGYYEVDTIIHLDQGGILTMVDRKSRFLAALPLENLTTPTTNKAMIKLITDLGNNFGKVKTITSDNGSEFWDTKN